MLELENVKLSIDGQHILNNVSLTLRANQIGCLLGPNGSGKTTLLQCIAGFRQPGKGRIKIHQTVVDDASVHVPTEKRRLGIMFQDYALFPHLSVEENIAFGIHHLPHAERAAVIGDLLQLTTLERCANRYPHELSGGQQQRVALARALAPNPNLLLLDEPFSNLDASLKLQLAREIRDILKQRNTTALIVTHDQDEALAMADVVGVMNGGKILQWGSAYNIYHRPASAEIATFIGMGTVILGQVTANDTVRTALGNFALGATAKAAGLSGRVCVLIRPDDIIHDDDSEMQAVIEDSQFRGADFLYRLRLESGETIYCFAPSHHVHRIGEAIGIKTQIEHVIIFPPYTSMGE